MRWRNEYEYEEEPFDRRLAKRIPAWAGLIIGLASLAATAAVIAALVSLFPPAGSRSSGPVSREEFGRLLMGKTTDEVIALLGRPDGTGDTGVFAKGYLCFDYRRRGYTFEPYSLRTDYTTTVRFSSENRVIRVSGW